MLEIIKQFVRRMLMGKGKGILQIAPKKDVDKFAKDLLKKFKDNGIPDEAITNPRDVKIIWEQITNREAQIMHTNLKDVLKKPDPFKKAGEVVDITGKKIDTSKPILGGKNVPETEAEIAARLTKENKEAIKRFKDKMKKDREDLAGGGIAGMLGEPTYADGGRIGLKDGFDPKRRGFLKLAAGLASIPLIGKYFKWAKPLAKTKVVDLTSVPIKDISGMPAWFKPLVNQVIKKGNQIDSGAERVITHKAKLPNSKTDIYVEQSLDTGDVVVDIGRDKHGFPDGHLGQPVRLEYKASEVIEPSTTGGGYITSTGKEVYPGMSKEALKTEKTKQGTKTKEEFWVEEAEFTGGHPENVKFEETVSEKFGSHGSNFDEVEKFATGKVKKKTGKASIKAERAHWTPEGDYASGGLAGMLGE